MHVTQGTQNVDPHDLIEPALAALGRQPVLVVAATGRADVAGVPFPTPPNARVAGLVPYGDLLPRTDAVITNGGWGGVLAALAAGIPLVVAGAISTSPRWPHASTGASYRAGAQRLAARLAEHDGPREVVEHTVRLLGDVRA